LFDFSGLNLFAFSAAQFSLCPNSIVLVPREPSRSPYNARLTREAVAPIRLAWKGQANGGYGTTFADMTNLFDTRAKGVTATLSRVESIVIRRSTLFNGYSFFILSVSISTFQFCGNCLKDGFS
jgi:hypothetical protein